MQSTRFLPRNKVPLVYQNLERQEMFSFTIKGQLATLNDHDAANRTNKFLGAKLKQEMTDLVTWQCKKVQRITRPCTLEFEWFFSGRHDLDNIRFGVKYILDGMVKARVLPDDNQKWVIGFDGDSFIKVPKGQEKVVIHVSEYEDV
jgi:Holliday junction resolvase RusA-like endonuclease